jgi:hypothetical protein
MKLTNETRYESVVCNVLFINGNSYCYIQEEKLLGVEHFTMSATCSFALHLTYSPCLARRAVKCTNMYFVTFADAAMFRTLSSFLVTFTDLEISRPNDN